MKKIFSNYYKIILSVVILVVLVALGEDYYTFDEMSGIWQVVRVLLYIAWGFLLATRIRRDKVKAVEYVAFAVVCVAALNLLIPIWKFQIAFYAFVAGVPGLYFMVFNPAAVICVLTADHLLLSTTGHCPYYFKIIRYLIIFYP